MKFTILGAQGFIGSAVTEFLLQKGHEVSTPSRSDLQSWLDSPAKLDLGVVIYCIGLTADFRERPGDTVEAHVTLLARLRCLEFMDSFIYLSSTRVYSEGRGTDEFLAYFRVPPQESGSLYNASKLMGETFTLQCMPNGRVVRLSNVYGPGDYFSPNFLPSVLRDAARSKSVLFRSSPCSSKDFVSIFDVVSWIEKIALSGKGSIYNLASGCNVSNRDIEMILSSNNVVVNYQENAPTVSFPAIDIARVSEEFGRPQGDLIAELPTILADYRLRTQND